MSRTETADLLVLGAGFAGASAAFFLSREPAAGRIVVLDREARPGLHSSGRNASLVRGPGGNPALDPLARAGTDFLRNPPPDFPADPCFRGIGSFFVDREERIDARCVGSSQRVDMDEVLKRVPDFRAREETAAVWTPDDGTVDIAAVLGGFIQGAEQRGVRFEWGEEAQDLELESGRLIAVRTSQRRIVCPRVVIAGGAWASRFAALLGRPQEYRVTRRHIGVTAPLPELDPQTPYVWDLQRGFYFRPEQGGLLVCACDETDDEAGDCQTDPEALAQLRRRFQDVLPRSSAARLRRFWAGHRTFAPDRLPSLGADSQLEGVYWCGGLGGVGLSIAGGLGEELRRRMFEE